MAGSSSNAKLKRKEDIELDEPSKRSKSDRSAILNQTLNAIVEVTQAAFAANDEKEARAKPSKSQRRRSKRNEKWLFNHSTKGKVAKRYLEKKEFEEGPGLSDEEGGDDSDMDRNVSKFESGRVSNLPAASTGVLRENGFSSGSKPLPEMNGIRRGPTTVWLRSQTSDESTIPRASKVSNVSTAPEVSTVRKTSRVPNASTIQQASTLPNESTVPKASRVSNAPRVLNYRPKSINSPKARRLAKIETTNGHKGWLSDDTIDTVVMALDLPKTAHVLNATISAVKKAGRAQEVRPFRDTGVCLANGRTIIRVAVFFVLHNIECILRGCDPLSVKIKGSDARLRCLIEIIGAGLVDDWSTKIELRNIGDDYHKSSGSKKPLSKSFGPSSGESSTRRPAIRAKGSAPVVIEKIQNSTVESSQDVESLLEENSIYRFSFDITPGRVVELKGKGTAATTMDSSPPRRFKRHDSSSLPELDELFKSTPKKLKARKGMLLNTQIALINQRGSSPTTAENSQIVLGEAMPDFRIPTPLTPRHRRSLGMIYYRL
ncbi:hypothetical protein G7Y89_g9669 [Cudoniella acicularis]|uniref:Uncharacterized protein n=1 Tax=Cudoniella acicularis TaxID=354080 RepID=A0A8H4RGI0_9HELO|nr:hypothetical protein G7Y89_g9669 [Cudoniella acicularis]